MRHFKRPLVHCLLWYVLGLWLARDAWSVMPAAVAGCGAIMLSVAAALVWRRGDTTPLLLLLCCGVGFARMEAIENERTLAAQLVESLHTEKQHTVAARVCAPAQLPGETMNLTLDQVHVTSGSAVLCLPGRMLLTVSLPSGASQGSRLPAPAERMQMPLAPFVPGDRITFSGEIDEPHGWVNFVPYNRQRNLELQRVYYTARLFSPDAVQCAAASGGAVLRLQAWLATVRHESVRILAQHLPAGEAATAACLLFNDTRLLSEEDQEVYRLSGTMHLFAVSGMHVAIFAFMLLVLLRCARLSPRIAWTLVVALLALYIVLLDFISPAVRALLMASAWTLGLWLRREVDALSSTAFGAALILWFEPLAAWQASFRLSMLGVLGLVLLLPLLRSWMWVGVRPKGIAHTVWQTATDGLLVTISCTLMLLPVQFYLFHQFNLLSPVANILAGLLSAPLLGGTLGTLVFGALVPPLADLFGAATACLMYAIRFVARITAQQEWAIVRLPQPHLAIVFLYYALLASGYYVVRRDTPEFRPKSAARFAIHISAAIALFFAVAAARFVAAPLKIWFLDVGQGDATVVQLPSGQSLLVDAGNRRPDVGRSVVEPQLAALGIRPLGTALVTHDDSDHAGGFESLFRRYPVTAVASAQGPDGTDDLTSYAKQRAMQCIRLRAGEIHHVDSDTELRVLNAACTDTLSAAESDNAQSVVLLLRYREFSALLMADAEGDVEQRIDAAVIRDCDVLKVAHHGSRNGTSATFLATVRPKAAVISCGRRNRYRHPHPEVLTRLNDAGARVYRTDLDGAVLVESDGRQFCIRTAR